MGVRRRARLDDASVCGEGPSSVAHVVDGCIEVWGAAQPVLDCLKVASEDGLPYILLQAVKFREVTGGESSVR